MTLVYDPYPLADEQPTSLMISAHAHFLKEKILKKSSQNLKEVNVLNYLKVQKTEIYSWSVMLK